MEKYKRWIADLAPLVIVLFFVTSGFSGCFLLPDSSENLQYFHPDHIGSVKFVTDKDGNKIAEYNYDPYGKLLVNNSNGLDLSGYKYTGQKYDSDTDIYYYKARYYDANIGRFITPDSVVPDAKSSQAYNRYMYVKGDPINHGDPDGHGWGKFWKKVGRALNKYVAKPVTGAVLGAVAGAYIGFMAGLFSGNPLYCFLGAIAGAGLGAAYGGYVGYTKGYNAAGGMALYGMWMATTGLAYGANPITITSLGISGMMMGSALGAKTIFYDKPLFLVPYSNYFYNENNGKFEWNEITKTNWIHLTIGMGLNSVGEYWDWGFPGMGSLTGFLCEFDQVTGFSYYCLGGKYYDKNNGYFGYNNGLKEYDDPRDWYTFSQFGGLPAGASY